MVELATFLHPIVSMKQYMQFFKARSWYRGLLWLLASKVLNANYIEVQHILKMPRSLVRLKFHKHTRAQIMTQTIIGTAEAASHLC